jgi:SAM-dependent methyltransferase
VNSEKWDALNRTVQDSPTGIDGNTDEIGIKAFAERFILPYAPPSLYPKILDLGCGPGTELKVLKELGYDPTGITYGAPNIDYSVEMYGILPHYGDMHDLPYRPNTFDVALARQVFEHSFAPWLLMLETWVVLKPGGRFIIDLPSPRNRAMWAMWHCNLLYPPQMEFMIEKCGFKIILADIGKIPWNLNYDGGGEPYDYVLEKTTEYPDNLQHVLRQLEEIHRR